MPGLRSVLEPSTETRRESSATFRMNETRLHAALRTVTRDLEEAKAACALVGGLAVSARTEPRFTRDVDLAVSVSHDRDAETLTNSFRLRGYRVAAIVEQESTGRLATVRLVPSGDVGLFVDLLFASSGIESEIVAAADPIEIIEGLSIPVATIAHLIATKVLSLDDVRRPQDRMDLTALLAEASERDLLMAREALRLIGTRGFHRGKDLLSGLDSLLA